jgi:broad specificity phosphatase PhoE
VASGAATSIVIARHGETDWNREGRFQGHADPPLNALGRLQAEELATLLARIEIAALYTSDLRRAAQTAEIVGARLGLVASPDRELREIDVGSWSGLTGDEIAARFPEAHARWLNGEPDAHGGETRAAFSTRVVGAIVRVAQAHPGQRIAVVAHGGVIRTVQRHVAGMPEPVLRNGGIWELVCEHGVLHPARPGVAAAGAGGSVLI